MSNRVELICRMIDSGGNDIKRMIEKTLEKTEGVIKNGQSRDTGNMMICIM